MRCAEHPSLPRSSSRVLPPIAGVRGSGLRPLRRTRVFASSASSQSPSRVRRAQRLLSRLMVALIEIKPRANRYLSLFNWRDSGHSPLYCLRSANPSRLLSCSQKAAAISPLPRPGSCDFIVGRRRKRSRSLRCDTTQPTLDDHDSKGCCVDTRGREHAEQSQEPLSLRIL